MTTTIMWTHTWVGVPLSQHTSGPLSAALPIGKGHGIRRFSLVVRKAEGCARSSSHGVGPGALGVSFSFFFSSFFSSFFDDEDDEEDAWGSGGISATMWFHMRKKLMISDVSAEGALTGGRLR